jgi:hypothetical protein
VKEEIMAYQDPSHHVRNLRGRDVHTYEFDQSNLDQGTGTSQETRDFVNDPATAKPAEIQFGYSVGRGFNGSGEFANGPDDDGQYQAGHRLARQNGGYGDRPEEVFPQNGAINMGHAGTHADWRQHEQAIHDHVRDNGGTATWQVTEHAQPRKTYGQ